MSTRGPFIISKDGLETIIENLKLNGYRVVGPKLRGGVIVLDEINSVNDLPIGYVDAQGPGKYGSKRSGGSYFSYVNGPFPLKYFLYPPEADLLKVVREEGKIKVLPATDVAERRAFLGVRACDLAALKILDKVLLGREYIDLQYKSLRGEAFILGVNCTRVGENCFCASMGTGPRLGDGFDLALTELADCFLLEVGSEEGAEVLSGVELRMASDGEVRRAMEAIEEARRAMAKGVDTSNLKEALYDKIASPKWDEIAKKCLSCGNCTTVCPTCFCTDVLDEVDLVGNVITRKRVWDSCFNIEFAETVGGNPRPVIRDRFRQRVMHKMAYWVDQFGTFGCVGCGRCITWCPAGIDITEVVRALRGG